MHRIAVIAILLVGCGDGGCNSFGRGFGFGPSFERRPSVSAAGFTNSFSVNLDGTDEHLNCGDPTALDNVAQATVAFWVRPNGGLQNAGVVSKLNTSHFEIRLVNNGTIRWYFPGGVIANSSAALTANAWSFVVVVYDGNQGTAADRIAFYVDDVDVTGAPTGTLPTTLGSNNSSLLLGGTTAAVNLLTGNIDELGWWPSHAASSAQATELLNNGDPFDYDTYSGGSPSNWWRLGDGSTHPTIEDIGTPGGFNCTMTNTEADDIAAETPP